MCICICKCDLKIVALKGSTASSAYTQSLPYCVSKTSNQSLKTKIRRKTNQSLHDLVRIYTVAALLRFNFFFCKTQKGSDCEQNVQNKKFKNKNKYFKTIPRKQNQSLHSLQLTCQLLSHFEALKREMPRHVYTYIYTFKVYTYIHIQSRIQSQKEASSAVQALGGKK